MPSLTLGTPSAVSRSGATHTWSGLGTFPGTSATSTGYVPGDKSYYVRFQITPGSPLGSLPASLALSVSAVYAPALTGTVVIDDTAALGDSSGPTGTNAANLAPISGTQNYLLSTSGFSLADLNAGNIYLWLSYKSDPASYGPFVLSYSGVGTSDNNGTPGTWAGTPPYSLDTGNKPPPSVVGDENGTLTVGVSGPGAYAVLDVTVTTAGSLTAIVAAGHNNVITLTDGYGGSHQTIGEGTQSDSLATVKRVRVTLSGGVGSTSVTAHARVVTDNPIGNARVLASATVSATAVTPDASTITLSTLNLSYTATGGGVGPGASPTSGTIAPQDEPEMTTLNIGDTWTFWAQLTKYSDGSASDATGTPAYRIYEETTDTPILTGSLALQDDSNTVGFYKGSVTASALNGFEVGKSYVVRVTATVDGVSQAGIVERAIVRATTSADVLSQITAYFNAAGVETVGAPSSFYEWLMQGMMVLTNEQDREAAQITLKTRAGADAAIATVVDGEQTAMRGAYE